MLSSNEAFARRFEFVSFPCAPNPRRDDPGSARGGGTAALVIPQRVDDGYRDGVGAGTETLARIAGNATVVRWPDLYWAGYFPDLFYLLRDAAGEAAVDGPFDYHDRSILEAYRSGMDVAGVCRLLRDPDPSSDAPAWAANATAQLEARGQDCDIDVTSFISSGFREQLLFFTMNHPVNRLLAFTAQQIADLIGVGGRVDDRAVPEGLLGRTFHPLHANRVRALELTFGADVEAGRCPFKLQGRLHGEIEAVQAFFDYYAANPRLVELNLDPVAA
jgi:hypothetical protein